MCEIMKALAFTVTFFFLGTAYGIAATLLPYDQSIANTASVYTVHNDKYEVLIDKNIAVKGRILDVAQHENEYALENYSIIIDTYNIFNINKNGYSNNFTKVVFPFVRFPDPGKLHGKKILIRGNVSSAGLLKEYFNGEPLSYIGFDHCTVWLEQ